MRDTAILRLRTIIVVLLTITTWTCASEAFENGATDLELEPGKHLMIEDDWRVISNGLYGSYARNDLIHINFVPNREGYNFFSNPVDHFITATSYLTALHSNLSTDPFRGGAYKRLEVTGKGHGNGSLVDWTVLISTLTYLHALEELHWSHDEHIPAAILEILDSFIPSCKLYYTLNFGLDTFRDRKDSDDILIGPTTNFGYPPGMRDIARRTSFVPSNALYRLDLQTAEKFSAYQLQTDILREILRHSPNLRELRLKIPQHVTSESYNSASLQLDLAHYDEENNVSTRDATLRVLELNSHWYSRTLQTQHPVYQSMFQSRHFQNFFEHNRLLWNDLLECSSPELESAQGHNQDGDTANLEEKKSEGLDTWLRDADLAFVQDVSIAAPSGHALYRIGLLSSHITKLTLLDLVHRADLNLTRFFIQIKPLRSLHVSFDYEMAEADCSNFGPLVEGLRSQHGRTLRELRLLVKLPGFLSLPPPQHVPGFTILNPTQLQSLAPSMVVLDTLELSLPRPEENPDQFVSYIAAIGSMPNLRRALIRINSHDRAKGIYLDDFMNEWINDKYHREDQYDNQDNRFEFHRMYQAELERRQAELDLKYVDIGIERLADDSVNEAAVETWLRQIRQSQALSSPKVSSPGGSLEEIEVILGQWSWRTWELAPAYIGRMYQAPVVSGRFVCRYVNPNPPSQKEEIVCSGGYRWSMREHYPPSYWPDVQEDMRFENAYCIKWQDNTVRTAIEVHNMTEADAKIVWGGAWDPTDQLKTY